MGYKLEYEDGPFSGLLSIAEAAEIWQKNDSAIRRAIMDGRLKPGSDCRKFGKQWVLSVDAMIRVFGYRDYWTIYLANLRKDFTQ